MVYKGSQETDLKSGQKSSIFETSATLPAILYFAAESMSTVLACAQAGPLKSPRLPQA